MEMDKNTILAIVLSGVVLIGWLFIDAKYIMPKQQAARAQQETELAKEQAEKERKAQELSSLISAEEAGSELSESDEDAETSAQNAELPSPQPRFRPAANVVSHRQISTNFPSSAHSAEPSLVNNSTLN